MFAFKIKSHSGFIYLLKTLNFNVVRYYNDILFLEFELFFLL